MKRILASIVLLCIADLAVAETALPPREQATKPVTIVWHKTEQAWRFFAQQYPNAKSGATLSGFYKVVDGVCHVWAPDNLNRLADLGHEVKHCFDGKFHD